MFENLKALMALLKDVIDDDDGLHHYFAQVNCSPALLRLLAGGILKSYFL